MGAGASTKGFIKNLNSGAVREFLFNPTGFSDEVAINFSEITSGGARKSHQYTGRENREVKVEIYLKSDSEETFKRVHQFKNFIEDFIPNARFIAPPLMLFCYGEYIKKCMVTNISREWLEFNKDLMVTELVISLTLKEVG